MSDASFYHSNISAVSRAVEDGEIAILGRFDVLPGATTETPNAAEKWTHKTSYNKWVITLVSHPKNRLESLTSASDDAGRRRAADLIFAATSFSRCLTVGPPCLLITDAADRARLVPRSQQRPRLVILIHGHGPEGPSARAHGDRRRHWALRSGTGIVAGRRLAGGVRGGVYTFTTLATAATILDKQERQIRHKIPHLQFRERPGSLDVTEVTVTCNRVKKVIRLMLKVAVTAEEAFDTSCKPPPTRRKKGFANT